MKRAKIIFAVIVLSLIGATALVLTNLKAHQRLGEPGIKTRPRPDSKNLEVLLPETLPGYTSILATNAEEALLRLPPDTSFRVRLYQATDGFWAQLSTVLMGSDRSSIHKPEICMTGQGWAVDNAVSRIEKISLDRPFPYELPVNKLITTKQLLDADGKVQTVRGIYVYWFVDGSHYTARSRDWMLWWVPRDLLLNGVLERWAYISFFAACAPGQEEATFDRMKKLIAAAVPEFQLVPPPRK
jgi:hypothetical protein